jgi:hypothetical protein
MNNKLEDLNNHLFAQLERLSNEDLKGEGLIEETLRAKAVDGIARNIISNAKITLEGHMFAYQHMDQNHAVPEQFKLKKNN